MSQVLLDESNFSVRFVREGMSLDLGAYAKGYAIDRAVESLRENGVTCALLHGGTSSVFGLGAQPQSSAWKVALDAPFPVERKAVTVELCDRALSVSGVRGRSFEVAGRRYGHVIDPRSGRPVDGALAAAVAGPSAEVCEALSTALLVAGPAWLSSMADHFTDYWGAVAFNRSDNQVAIEQTGPTN
jgi:thiamine biosynthesis lipoprotein